MVLESTIEYAKAKTMCPKVIVPVHGALPKMEKLGVENFIKIHKNTPKEEDEFSINNNPPKLPHEHFSGVILTKIIGEGGFATIYECHYKINPKVKFAIKIEKWNEKAFQAYKIIPNGCRNFPIVYEIGQSFSRKEQYVIMEILKPWGYQTVLTKNHIVEILYALEILAGLGISHGDIKTENLMFRGEELVVVDFGLSRYYNDGMTKKNAVFGTPLFLSRNSHDGIITEQNDLESLCFMILDERSRRDLEWDYFEDNLLKMSVLKTKSLSKITTNPKDFVERYKISYYTMEFIKHITYNRFKTFDYKKLRAMARGFDF